MIPKDKEKSRLIAELLRAYLETGRKAFLLRAVKLMEVGK
jgi:hypothetical protein